MPWLQEWAPRQKLPKVQRMADLFAVSSSGPLHDSLPADAGLIDLSARSRHEHAQR
jgi:hypothetical protein